MRQVTDFALNVYRFIGARNLIDRVILYPLNIVGLRSHLINLLSLLQIQFKSKLSYLRNCECYIC